MGAHKRARQGLLARTSSAPADVLRMAEVAAATQPTDWFRGLGVLSVDRRSSSVVGLAVMGGLGGLSKQIVFTVSAEADAGTTAVRTAIEFSRTSQRTVLGFLPAGRKRMSCYATYKLFLDRLSATMREADPAAVIVISNTVDSTPLPAPRATVED